MAPDTKKVAVVGFGNIGAGVVDVLYNQGVTGVELARVVDIDIETPRPVTVPGEMLSKDWHEAVDDPEIDIIIELIGGVEPACSVLTEALRKGKDVVTANKMLLAHRGEAIFSLATELKRRIGLRASFVGCHALIHEFQQAGVSAKAYRRVYAILNGTSNYILSTMTRDGKGFEEALREAQERGLAEPDPTDDVDGNDTANKIRLVLSLITNSYRMVHDILVEGIRDVTIQDIGYADDLEYAIKLVGIIEQTDGAFHVAVHPALVPKTSLLGSLLGANNGTEIEDEYGVVSGLVAPGAGVAPTATAVVKDLLDIVEGGRLPMPNSAHDLTLGATEDAKRRYYLRFSVDDQAGVIAQISSIFWKHDISIAGVIQEESVSDGYVPLVITTHLAREGNVHEAVVEVDQLKVVRAATRMIRVLNADT